MVRSPGQDWSVGSTTWFRVICAGGRSQVTGACAHGRLVEALASLQQTGILDVELADTMPEGWRLWLERAPAPRRQAATSEPWRTACSAASPSRRHFQVVRFYPGWPRLGARHSGRYPST